MKDIKAVIFDLDNTLIDRQRAFNEMVHQLIPGIVKENSSQAIKDILIWDNHGTTARIEVFKLLAQKYDISPLDAEKLNAYWSSNTGDITYLFDDVLPTLDYLQSKYKLAVLTNGDKSTQRRKLASINIDEYLECSVVSGEFGSHKPDPSVFLHVANQLGLKPEQCVYIGDNYKVDIIGAQNTGMHAIFINRFNTPVKDICVIFQLKDLISIL